jgi:hypothetical protein
VTGSAAVEVFVAPRYDRRLRFDGTRGEVESRVSVVEPSNKETVVPERRLGVERRQSDRRVAARARNPSDVERRMSERRIRERRADAVPPLICPDCHGPLQYDAALSWSMPGVYTVDTGYCPSCARRFLRNRETGDYDTLSL